MLYFQTPIIKKFPKTEIELQDLKHLAVKYLNLCKQTRNDLPEDNQGVFVVKNIKKIEEEIQSSQCKLSLDINFKIPTSYISVKPSLFNMLMNYSGILGYYNPFTSESQYNPNLPSVHIPFTIAHEMSHQLGFAREEEASYVAFLCAERSNDPVLKYSTELYVLKSLLRNISLTDKDFVNDILKQYSIKMQKDRMNEMFFFDEYNGMVSDFFGITNDMFLKYNQQDGAVSYSYFVTLLVLHEKKKESYKKYDSKNTNDEKKFISPE